MWNCILNKCNLSLHLFWSKQNDTQKEYNLYKLYYLVVVVNSNNLLQPFGLTFQLVVVVYLYLFLYLFLFLSIRFDWIKSYRIAEASQAKKNNRTWSHTLTQSSTCMVSAMGPRGAASCTCKSCIVHRKLQAANCKLQIANKQTQWAASAHLVTQ